MVCSESGGDETTQNDRTATMDHEIMEGNASGSSMVGDNDSQCFSSNYQLNETTLADPFLVENFS